MPVRATDTPLRPAPFRVTWPETVIPGGNKVLLAVEIAELFGVNVTLPEDVLPVIIGCPPTVMEKFPVESGGVMVVEAKTRSTPEPIEIVPLRKSVCVDGTAEGYKGLRVVLSRVTAELKIV